MRGGGYIVGALLKVKLIKNLNFHTGLSLGCILAGVGSFLLTLSYNQLWIGLAALMASMGVFLTEMFSNLSIIRLSGEQAEKYVRINYAFSSLGAIAVNLSISFLGFITMKIIGILLLFLAVGYYLLPPFEEKQKTEEEI